MSEIEPRLLTIESSEPSPGVDLLLLKGELDFASSGELATVLARLAGPCHVVVDLSELAFVDSSGVKMLVAATRAVESAGGSFVLTTPNATVHRVFEILHLDEVVTVVDDREQALADAERVAGDVRARGDAQA
jgi:anti-anti-sigma factor